MVATHYSVAVLSTDISVYQRLQTLLVGEQAEDLQLVWLDLTTESALQSLGRHNLYLSDAPLPYLIDHAEVLQRWPWIGLADEVALQDEMLRLGVLDCFLWSELTGPLLVHTLRVALRTMLGHGQGTLSPAPLGDFQGDRLQTLIQNIPGTVYRCLNTAEWHGIYFSETIEQLVGYPAADFLPGGDRHYASLIHPNDRAFVRQIVERKVQEKKPFAFEYRLKHRDGTVRWVDERGQGVFDDQGNLLWLDGVIIDISEKKAIALELNQQAIHYYEKTPAMLHSMDATGQILAVSDRWLQVLGYERRQVIGCNVTDFLTPVSRQKAQQILLLTLTTQGSVEDDAYQFIKKNGDILEVELAAVCEQTNHHSRLLVVLTDVTARNHLAQQVNRYQTHLEDLIEQRTQALAASQARLAQAQAIAQIGVWEWDVQANQTYWSPETFQIFGFAPGEIQPNAETFFERVHPDDRDRIRTNIENIFTGQSLPSSEYRIITPDGEVRYLKDYHELKLDKQGQPSFLWGAVQDITKMQQTLNALQKSETRFRELVEHIDEAFWINSPDPTEVIYVSPNYEKIWGLSCQSLLDDGTSWLAAVHPDHEGQIQRAIAQMQQGQNFDEEYRIVRPDGVVRWIYARSFKIYDPNTQQLLRHVGVMTDVTERKEAELKLQSQEARLRTIFDQAALGIVQIDRTNHFSLVNQAFCEICGYSEAELQQFTWQELTHPEDICICHEARAKLDRHQAASAVLEKRYRHRLGHFIWVKVICSYIYDDQGQPEYLLTIIEDISEYKQAAIALVESQHRYQKMVDGIPAIIYQYSPQRGGLFYSSQVEQILGYEVQRLLDEPELWHRSIHPEDVVDVDQVLQTLHTGKNFELEYRIRDATGNWHWFYDCSFNIHAVDGGDLVIDGFALDITERKNFDEVLRHRLKLETMLAEMSHLMVVEAELNLEKVLALLGRTFQADRVSVMISQMEANSVERLVSWHAGPHLDLDENFNTIDLSAYPWWLDHWQQQKVILFDRQHPLPETAKPEQTLVAYLDLKAVLWVPIQDATGQPWGYIACSSTAVDHLLWSKEDADILAIAGNLIYNYYQRQQANKQLELAKELAEAANHAKNQFLTSMSHELRTPLNAVLGFTQIMERSPDLSTDHQEYLSIIHRSGKHLLALLNDILNLAKFEKGTLQLNPNLFNLHDLLDDLAQMYALEIQHKNIQLDIHWDEQVPRYINADQAKLHSVLLHLLNNALKFTDSGCVQLTVKTLAQNPLRLRFSVTDTGIGIAETDFTRLFDNFVKLEAGDRMGQGSGLGLALSQKFVNLMGGEIVVSSQPGVGSCFSFELTGATPANPMHLALYPPQARDEQLPALTPEALQKFPPEWLTAFHQAALAARAQHLKALIDQLPPQATAIARALEILVQKFAFDTLAKLSQQRTPNDFSSSKGETGS
ncbi:MULTISPECIES: PAS domain-containing protein [Cyanophyceae]|uniref:PAS domain-containing sensor histidine kinase n=1 Tax=Cyanophyceae TaxID=3028117 RepID=UPI00016DCE8B|nr:MULTISPECIES: PAS domain-containing protein [Cyanophyceae]ACB00621.1 PAS domain S-box protein [Picosynechococcus sp. PCC 7002]SMH50880.1 PAS domain S-box-containing protein [Picosynechococcus sp. OG1]SMQ81928.1 PAS domain S-box-containing protein [Synechococcus sp. 7002]